MIGVRRREKEIKSVLSSAVEPAAHLDPGPDGHDIYGPFGQALARVCVSLDPQTVLDNLQIEQSTQDRAVQSLHHCRRQLARYLAALSSPWPGILNILGTLPPPLILSVPLPQSLSLQKMMVQSIFLHSHPPSCPYSLAAITRQSLS